MCPIAPVIRQISHAKKIVHPGNSPDPNTPSILITLAQDPVIIFYYPSTDEFCILEKNPVRPVPFLSLKMVPTRFLSDCRILYSSRQALMSV
jgi:hypothetical protein